MVRDNGGMGATKYFIYARKSTKGDDRQALSIPAQLRALENLAEQQCFKIVETITERQSAHFPGRPLFTAMLKRIEAGEASGIIAWHPDRLARNSKDGGDIIYLLDIHKLTDLKFSTYWFENTPQGKAQLGHTFVETKQFSDKLAADTKRGLMEKAQLGRYPNKAPRGYLNNPGSKTIVLDPELAPIIKSGFERYANGNCTFEDLRFEFADHGILSQPNKRWQSAGGNLIHSSLVRRMLTNPFYYGHFEYAGERFEGKHPPLITKELFDHVQQVLNGRSCRRQPKASTKAFTRLLRCETCHMMITAEVQKGHVYYRCTKKSTKTACSEPFIREEELDRQITDLLLQCCLPDGWAEEMFSFVERDHKEFLAQADRELQEARQAMLQTKDKLQKLLSIYLDTAIEREVFLEHKVQLLKEKKRIEEQINACEQHRCPWLEPLMGWLKTAQNQRNLALLGSRSDKRDLAATIFGSNLTLSGKTARGKAVKLWSLLQNKSPNLSPVRCYQSARQLIHRCLKGKASF